MEIPTEKKYRIHFPLNKISAPVVTHLVTDFDLSPNLLRADLGTTVLIAFVFGTDLLH